MTLLHICGTGEWAAGDPEHYTPEAFAVDGFIHLSRPDQVERPANRFYAGRADLVLLLVDDRQLPAAALRWEPSAVPDEDGELFPHLYGPLARSAVSGVVDFPPDADGHLTLPAALG